VEVNDELVSIENNSLKIVEGQGSVNTRTASRGGDIIVVPAEDLSTKIGKVMFDVPMSVSSANFFRDVKARPIGTNTVVVSGIDPAGNRLARTLVSASMVNDPEKLLQTEGKFSVEFEGAPLVVA
jgi:hypothetical protein